MANNCAFDMRIAGKEPAVMEFVQMLRWEGPFEESGLGRVYSFDLDESMTERANCDSSTICVFGFGDCAWSLQTAMLDWPHRPMLPETQRLGLVVEAFSSEPGIGFQEHILINQGQMIVDECVDYEEHLIDDEVEEWYIEQVCEDHGLTREELMNSLNCNGEFIVGGLDNYCDFEDLFSYLEPEHKPALQDLIHDAAARSTNITHESHEPAKDLMDRG